MATILIADDHPTNRMLLMTLLKYDKHLLLEAVNGLEALALVQQHHPDLVITDLLMPEMDGFELVQRLRSRVDTLQTRVIVYTAHYTKNEAMVLACVCGIQHFLPKPSEPELILSMVNAALHDSFTPDAISPQDFDREHRRLLTNTLLHKVNESENEPAGQELTEHTNMVASDSLKQLTPRQRETLQLIAEGCSTQEIAQKLFISVKTVETHRAHLMNRLNIHNVAGLVRYAISQSLLPTQP